MDPQQIAGHQFRRVFRTRKIGSSNGKSLDMAFSSEEPYDRGGYIEILDHSDTAVRMERLNSGAALLVNHTESDQVGVVESARIDPDRIGRASVRFGQSPRAQEIYQDVIDGIRPNVSVGYIVHFAQQAGADENGTPIIQVTDWEPIELTIAAIPADSTVGFGRSLNNGDLQMNGIEDAIKNETGTLTRSQRKGLTRAQEIESTRIADLRVVASLYAKHGANEIVESFVRSGESVDDFQRALMVKMTTGHSDAREGLVADYPEQRGATPIRSGSWASDYGSYVQDPRGYQLPLLARNQSVREHMGRSGSSEYQNLNLGKFIKGAITGNWRNAELEQRAMSEGVLGAGGYMVPTPLAAELFDLSRNLSVLLEAGARTVLFDSQSLKIARVITDPVAAWKAENAAITKSDMAVDSVVLTARTLTALVPVSLELLEDAPNASAAITETLAAGLALELDRAGLLGSGAGSEPTGIFNAAGVQSISMGTNGAALTNFSQLSQAVQKVWEANSTPTAAIYAPRTAGVLDRLVDTTGQPMVPPPSFQELKRLVSNQVPVTQVQGTSGAVASCAFVGDFSKLIVGMRTNLTIQISSEAGDASGSAFSSLQYWIRTHLRADIALTRPNQFVKVIEIL